MAPQDNERTIYPSQASSCGSYGNRLGKNIGAYDRPNYVIVTPDMMQKTY